MVDKIILTKEQVYELVYENRYPVDEKKKFLTRCIDGRYEGHDLNPLAFPGADLGELALLFGTANTYGFEIDKKTTLQSLLEVLGGAKHFSFHSDHHAKQDKSELAMGCGHWKQMKLDPQAYNLKGDQMLFIADSLKKLEKKGAKETVLEGDHQEGAVLIVRGNYGVLPKYVLEDESKRILVEVFVYQATLSDSRHRVLSKKLLENKAVELFPGCD